MKRVIAIRLVVSIRGLQLSGGAEMTSTEKEVGIAE